jgi:hypothetical protein
VRNSSDESMVATLPWNHGVFMARVGKKDDYSPLINMVLPCFTHQNMEI